MSQSDQPCARVPVSAEVARIVSTGAPREIQLAAAQGALPLAGTDLLTALAFLCASTDAELKSAAAGTLRTLPLPTLLPALDDPALHPRLLDLLARLRLHDPPLLERIINHPAVDPTTWLYLAQRASQPVLAILADRGAHLGTAVIAALAANPQADQALRRKLERLLSVSSTGDRQADAADDEVDDEEVFPPAVDGDPTTIEEVSDEEIAALLQDAETSGLSKYQLSMDLKVAEKIKIAMTGDKEWRKILIKDPNKLVHGAVLKNGRITEGEVLAVARNKSTSDELVRLILLNRDWLKHYEIRKALVTHPKTPLAKALRFAAELHLRDLKELARSRNVSSVIATAARKELQKKMQRGG